MKVKRNLDYISFLQIIGPIFVVLGHSLNGFDSRGIWYIFTKKFIYFFHMPLFFLISGYLLSHNGWMREKSYLQFSANKFKRLIIPYVFWNLLFIMPKIAFSTYLVDNITINLFEILKLFIYPRQNIWGHTWFLAGLFILFLATPIFEKLNCFNRYTPIIIIFFCIVLYCLPLHSEFLCINDLHKGLLFFELGIYLGILDEVDLISKMKKRKWITALFACVTSIIFLYWYEVLAPFRFIPCFFILITLFGFACEVKHLSNKAITLSKDSFGIYIMHWPVMLLCRIFLFQILKLNVVLCIVIMILAGYFIPVLTINLLRKITNEKIRKPLRFLLGV